MKSKTVYRWIEKHNMLAHRMGRFLKFKRDEVEEWVKDGVASDKARQDKSE